MFRDCIGAKQFVRNTRSCDEALAETQKGRKSDSAAFARAHGLSGILGSPALAPVIGVAGLAVEARIAAGRDTHAICGGDGRTLATLLACAVAGDCRGLISFGIAGGLSPDLRAGTCIVGSKIHSGTTQFATDGDWSRNLLRVIPGALHGAIAGVSAPIAHPKAKRALYLSTGALVVDNESHLVASAALRAGLPMAAVRVVLDSSTRELPAAALVAVRANGTIDLGALIRSVMRNPSELPMLLRTALDALMGFGALLRCRQLLGSGLGLPGLHTPEPDLETSLELPDPRFAA